MGVVVDRVVDRVDPGGVPAGADDQGQRVRRQVKFADLHGDRVAGPVSDDGRGVGPVLRLQADPGGADVLAVDAGVDQRVDYGLLPLAGLVHRGGDVGCGELDRDVGRQQVRRALNLPATDDGDLPAGLAGFL